MNQYYDLDNGRIYNTLVDANDLILNPRIIKDLNYPSVIPGLYAITDNGIVINKIINNIVLYNPLRNGSKELTVNLSCKIDDIITVEPFKVSNLMASSFIRDANIYFERGYQIRYKDGNSFNLAYNNLEFVLA